MTTDPMTTDTAEMLLRQRDEAIADAKEAWRAAAHSVEVVQKQRDLLDRRYHALKAFNGATEAAAREVERKFPG